MPERLPVVFVHGIRMSGAAWTAVTDRVDRVRPVATVDLPGHGSRRGERFTVAGSVETICGAIDSVGGQALVVGHSLGGYLGIAGAGSAPEKVAGLVVAGSTCVPTRVRMTPFTLMHRVLSGRADGGHRASSRLFHRVLPVPVAHAVVDAGIATEVIPDVVEALCGFDVLAALDSYSGPTTLVNGRHDHFRLQEHRFLRHCRDGRLVVVPRAGHYLPLIHTERFAELVLEAATAAEGTVRR
ncbi:alpha/beta fold hydrolase [Nocardia caishijiensis]|uniref:Pimeloyl-ACP methyl ester carboxylesterase n=1 Tax=Nocardia caishijiensis TaxID=184756 RepID=A0ABQ6YHW9_9NOCA|nr:alpha/beta hydrolase [Nocardia caishijiensis]KAF0845382.1 pimeloyl-ACP methyl ester carboxylesterase [Nocardia caishijiensis]